MMNDEPTQPTPDDSSAECFCPACGAPAGQAKFCPECGTEINQTCAGCAACGHRPEVATKFCPECGAPMA